MLRLVFLLAGFVFGLAITAGGSIVNGQEAAKEEAKKDEAKDAAATHKVAKGALRLEIELDGVFEAEQAAEVFVRPDVWAELTVLEAAAHGKQVEAGEALVKLDTQKIDDAIRDAEAAAKLAELTAHHAGHDYRLAMQSGPIDLVKAERAAQIATEDLKRFLEIDRPMSEKSAEIGLKLSAQGLEYQLEELRQLEKMYKADDLTEETEEIILKRARNDVEQARWGHERAKVNHDETLKLTLPRKQEDVERAAKTAAIELERAQATLVITQRQKEVAAVKAKYELADAVENLEKLKKDRAAMNVVAPIRGIVYYGKATKGKWAGGAEAAAVLRKGGKLPANEVFMTIVSPDSVLVRAVVPEKNLAAIKPGLAARVTATAMPDAAAAANLASLSAIPIAIGGLDGTATFKLAAGTKALPGMTCKVSLVPVNKENVVVVPSSAVFTDDSDLSKRYVLIAGDKPQRRDVRVGARGEEKVEILDGLKEGETILTKRPE